MARRNFSNTVSDSVLTTSTMSAASTTVNIDSGGSWPAAPFTALAEAEVLLVTGVSGGASTGWTVTRGFDGTTPAVHAIGVNVRHVAIANDYLRAASVSDQVADLTYPISVTPDWSDEFDDASVAGGWTKVEPTGTVNLLEGRDVLSVEFYNQASADMSGVMYSLATAGYTSAPITIEMCATMFSPNINYPMWGPVFSNGTATTSLTVNGRNYSQGSADYRIGYQSGQFDNPDAVASAGTQIHRGMVERLKWRLAWTATNTFKMEWSPDGVTWVRWSDTPASISRTMTPTHFGFMVTTWGGSASNACILTVEYVRLYDADLIT